MTKLTFRSMYRSIYHHAINGVQVLRIYDPFTAAGGKDKASVQEFTVTADGSGNIGIVFTRGMGDTACVAGIEILPGMKAVPAASGGGGSSASQIAFHMPEGGASLLRIVGVNVDGTSLNRQYHLDSMGSVLAITDGSGSVETSYVTDAWGNVIFGSAPGNTFDFMGGLGYWHDARQCHMTKTPTDIRQCVLHFCAVAEKF